MPQFQTTNASMATLVAATLNTPLKKMRLQPGDYVPELTTPDEVSTGDGVRAQQRLRLVPQRDAHPTLVFGSVNMKDKTAELRSFLYIDTAHRKRFKKSVPLSRDEYGALLLQLEILLRAISVKAAIVDTPSFEKSAPVSESDEDAAQATPRRRNVYWLLAILMALGTIVWWLRRAG
ncbi:MAG: hypothetical protein JWM74_2178 [Myxococcaceae bacterium]|jgi:hypothetical protein|nr:hypothetical protein [Myxococcaceae bacterium]